MDLGLAGKNALVLPAGWSNSAVQDYSYKDVSIGAYRSVSTLTTW